MSDSRVSVDAHFTFSVPAGDEDKAQWKINSFAKVLKEEFETKCRVDSHFNYETSTSPVKDTDNGDIFPEETV